MRYATQNFKAHPNKQRQRKFNAVLRKRKIYSVCEDSSNLSKDSNYNVEKRKLVTFKGTFC